MIYFIQSGDGGPVKIGKADDPKARMSELQTGSHERLHLRAVLDVPDEVEGYFHEQLHGCRIRGEWFVPGLPLNIAMACAQAGHVWTVPCLRTNHEENIKSVKPTHNRWDRDKYNAYQRDYMRKRRA